jgi:hypothetical protein
MSEPPFMTPTITHHPATLADIMYIDNYGERWCSRIYNLANVSKSIGEEVLVQFCRCFIHADRLISLAHLYYLISVLYHEGTITRQRNFGTILWFSAGTLTELGQALENLRSALKKRDLLEPGSTDWQTLTRVERLWHKNHVYRRLRNSVAFHVDAETLSAGLRKLIETTQPVFFVQADGKEDYQLSLRLGRQALAAGLGLDAQQPDKLGSFQQECSAVPDAIQGVFISTLIKAGGRFKKASIAVAPEYTLTFDQQKTETVPPG